jgi:hypothetical protein
MACFRALWKGLISMKNEPSINFADVPDEELIKAADAFHTRLALSFLLAPTNDEVEAEMQLGKYHLTMGYHLSLDQLFDRHGFDTMTRSIFRNDVSVLSWENNQRETFEILKSSYREIEPHFVYELMCRCEDDQPNLAD